MTIELLLEICRIDPEDSQLTPEILEDLRAVDILVCKYNPGSQSRHLPHAATLLTGALGRISRFNPTHLPFGFGGPQLKSHQWVDMERIDLILKQIIGLCQPAWDIQRVTLESHNAMMDAASLGFTDKKDYDGWLPGMPSGSGWRIAICATPYGVARARQAAAQVDMPLKEPEYPWRKMAPAPRTEGSMPAAPVAPTPPVAEPTLVETTPNIELLTPPPRTLKFAKWRLAEAHSGRPAIPSVDDRYSWARQVELVKAANQVLGDGELNAGVLCRACKGGEITTNRKCGRGALVEVKSFITWFGRKRELPKEELDQVRNAIMGEILARK
jgi:hypothetical protein